MSSLWTPEGEHRVPRPDDPGASPAAPAPRPSSPEAGAPEGAELTEEQMEQELREVAEQVAAAPAEEVVANHCYGLFELAAIHLSQTPPALEKARIAIDAMGLLVDGLGERLGAHYDSLVEGLSQLRIAYVRIAEAATSPQSNGAGDAPPAPDVAPE
jgi:hypothetical protein